MKLKTLKSEKMYRGRAFDVRRDQVQLPQGKVTNLDIVEHVGAVTIVPVDTDGQMMFVRQYRHPIQGLLLELPAGTLEEGESPEVCAAREIREEIGMAAQNLQKIGEFYLAPGYSTEFMHIYLATGLSVSPLAQDPGEYIQVEKYPVKKVFQMAEQGEIIDCKTLAILTLARRYLIA